MSFHLKSICEGCPVATQLAPKMTIAPMGMIVPRRTPTELIHPETRIPRKLISVAVQKVPRITDMT